MSHPQMTTTGGLAGLVASISSLAKLFNGYAIADTWQAFLSIQIEPLIVTLVGFCVSVWFIAHDEDKPKP